MTQRSPRPGPPRRAPCGAVEACAEARARAETAALVQASRIIFSNHDPSKLSEMIVSVAVDVMQADAVTLLLPGVDGKLYIACARGLSEAVKRATRITIGEGIAGRIAETRTPAIVNGDVSKPSRRDAAGQPPVRSSIVYPLTAAGSLVGLLTFNRTAEGRDYTEADLDVASVLASQIVLALENARFVEQNATSERLAAVGLLAAGIAHEINTPVQFVGDSMYFLRQSFADLSSLLELHMDLAAAVAGGRPTAGILDAIAACSPAAAVPELLEEIPRALERAAEGLDRVVEIVRAVKQFGRPDGRERAPVDVNRQLATTLTIARGEYKHVADLVTDLGEIPCVLGHAGELGQVFLNLVVNAAHAVADANRGSGAMGTITVRTRLDGGAVVVTVADTGCGIPEDVRARIFDPFFTTKEVGRGTGLGLSIARSIVDRHGGAISFETEVGRGTTFTVRLPVS
jgi:signal transduction histidine kinase